ncbi:ATP-grasp domain-containing protein [Candidatus Fermentibacteria bacterium]|nr:ATP-grasp domain-containing protein [Candidatus Fermentibacteria bacterium]
MRPQVVLLFNEPVNTEEPSEVGVIGEAEDIVSALESKGHAVESRPVSRQTLLPTLSELEDRRESVVVFNLCEGLNGHSHHEPLLAGLLELHRLRFTGSPSSTLSWALDKRVAKAILGFAGVRTPGAQAFCTAGSMDEIKEFALPAIVKPVREDGSLGITADSVVHTADELHARIRWVLETYRQPALVEGYLTGREFNMSILGEGDDARLLPVEEILFEGYSPGEPRLLSYDAKWRVGSHDDVRTIPKCPAAVDGNLRDAMESLALTTYQAFGCRDYARIDIRLDGGGTPHVLDVNPNPDISRVAGMALAVTQSGMSYEEFVDSVVEAAWNRTPY